MATHQSIGLGDARGIRVHPVSIHAVLEKSAYQQSRATADVEHFAQAAGGQYLFDNWLGIGNGLRTLVLGLRPGYVRLFRRREHR